jgi:putative ABC transport system permease protein
MNALRALFARLGNLFRREQLDRDLDNELASHLELHIAENLRAGMTPEEARRIALLKLGGLEQTKESVRDASFVAWLDSVRADVRFGWRQLKKNRLTSVAAILSLALAVGACTAAFRLVDALLLRPLPISHPERLYDLSILGTDETGKPDIYDSYSYPLFKQLRAAVKQRADLMAISYVGRTDLTFSSDREMEKAYLQFVSGWTFSTFGLRPALGRLLTEDDNNQPGAHPYAVITYDYWKSRFSADPNVLGKTFRLGNDVFQIIGVSEKGFVGTETGATTDVFIPITMNVGSLNCVGCGWFRVLVNVRPDVAVEPVREQLYATYHAFQADRAKEFVGMPLIRESLLTERLLMEPASAGVSNLQRDFRSPLMALAALVVLVLLIACANVANLVTAQASARAREMALRISIGAARGRLVQLVLVESAWIASLAMIVGAFIAWWSAPLVVRMINPPDDPARLALPADWRVFTFGAVLTIIVACLFGLFPALRASTTQPITALKGSADPRPRHALMRALVAVQVAFCFLVLLVAGLFFATFQRLSNQPTGFSANRLLVLETVVPQPQSPIVWQQVAEHLRGTPGLESVSLAGWPLLTGRIRNNFISVDGGPPGTSLAYFLNVSPGWLESMKISLLDGRDFRQDDADPGVAIVSDAFAKRYFPEQNPIGRSFQKTEPGGKPHSYQIVGLVPDVRYHDLRGPMLDVFYVPFQSRDESGMLRPVDSATIMVRTATANPMALASSLRQLVSQARSEFRVSNIRTQQEIIEALTVRERLLAMLASFFAVAALLLAAVGLYGVLYYAVVQRRREIGIRMAIGAQTWSIARLVALDVFSMVLVGALAGFAVGMVAVRYLQPLFYQVKPTDLGILAFPALAIFAAAFLAALPPLLHAIHVDPMVALRYE